MKINLILLFLLICGISKAQNLVPNPGFESYDSLPCDFILDEVQFTNMLHDWTVPNQTTPDICSPLIPVTCNFGNPFSPGSSGAQTPRTGNIMVGMVCENGGYNEYLQVALTTPLIPGNAYLAEMYVSLAARSDFACNDIAMYFSDTIISDGFFQSTNYLPQVLDTNVITDTSNWVLISGCFTATSAAHYLIIGNFYSDCWRNSFMGGGWPLAYYFFDDVSVTQIPACNGGQINCVTGIATTEVKPFNIYPNPVSGFLTIENTTNNSTIEIENMLGEMLLTQKLEPGKSQINLESLTSGIYILRYWENKYQRVVKLVKQ